MGRGKRNLKAEKLGPPPSRGRVNYLSDSSKPESTPTEYSYCESIGASGAATWHIRPLTSSGRHLSGGIDTDSLCGHVKCAAGGWDIDVPVRGLDTLAHTEGFCLSCHTEFKRRQA